MFTWLSWLPYVLSLDGIGLLPIHLTQLGILPGAFLGPFFSGFLMTAALEGKPGVGRLLRRFIPKHIGWQWYLLAVFGVPIIVTTGFLLQPGAEAELHPVVPQIFWVFPLALLLQIVTSGLAEEPGWRGFALPHLQRQCGPVWGSILLGILWQCWHLPLYLTEWGAGAGWFEITVAILGTIGLTVLMTWVFNHTRGNLFIAILLHASLDAFGMTAATSLFSMQWIRQHDNMALFISFSVVALILIIVTRGRLGYRQQSLEDVSTSEYTTSQLK